MSVIAASTATTTAPAAARPITVRNGMFTMLRAARAMRTVVPAKHTDDPEVATARPTESATSRPSTSCWRCRLRTNSE